MVLPIKNCQESHTLAYHNVETLPATVSWMLTEDPRLLEHKQSLYYLRTAGSMSFMVTLVLLVPQVPQGDVEAQVDAGHTAGFFHN